MKTAFEAQIRECFARVVWTHKTHEKCADLLEKNESNVKLLQIVLSTITSGGVVALLIADEFWLKMASALFSSALTAITLYYKNFSPGSVAQKHSQAALQLWDIRESYLSLLVDLKKVGTDVDELVTKRDALQQKLLSVYKASPRTFSKAYKLASDGLIRNQELTFSDFEIDSYLPAELRKAKEIK